MFFGSRDRAMLRQILKQQERIMSKIDDLKAAVGTIVTDFTDYSAAVDQKLAALQTAVSDSADDDELYTLTKELVDLHTAFKPKIAALATKADVPPPAPAPAPDPAPAPVADPAPDAPAAS